MKAKQKVRRINPEDQLKLRTAHFPIHLLKLAKTTYFQSVKHNPRLARGARVSVIHLLPDGLQQLVVVGGGGDGLSADVLDRAEGLCPQTQVMETLLKKSVSITRRLRV